MEPEGGASGELDNFLGRLWKWSLMEDFLVVLEDLEAEDVVLSEGFLVVLEDLEAEDVVVSILALAGGFLFLSLAVLFDISFTQTLLLIAKYL